MRDEPPLEDFIADTFVSVWSLELLAVLIEAAPAGLPAADLVARLRASEVVVSQSVEALVGAGLAQIQNDQAVVFQPVDEMLDDCGRRAVDFYRRFPGRTRRIIISRSAPGLTAFTDAFRIRKD